MAPQDVSGYMADPEVSLICRICTTRAFTYSYDLLELNGGAYLACRRVQESLVVKELVKRKTANNILLYM